MSLESPEKAENNCRQYYQEALAIAQGMSQRWPDLREKIRKEPYLLAENPDISEIESLTHSPVSGIQAWFEGQVKFIETSAGADTNAKSRMMYRLKEDVERLKQEFDDILK